jgi:hypothetical protein
VLAHNQFLALPIRTRKLKGRHLRGDATFQFPRSQELAVRVNLLNDLLKRCVVVHDLFFPATFQ